MNPDLMKSKDWGDSDALEVFNRRMGELGDSRGFKRKTYAEFDNLITVILQFQKDSPYSPAGMRMKIWKNSVFNEFEPLNFD